MLALHSASFYTKELPPWRGDYVIFLPRVVGTREEVTGDGTKDCGL